MDSLVPIIAAAITSSGLTFGGYWTYLQRRKDRSDAKEDQRIVDLKEFHGRERSVWERENGELRTKLAQANDLLSQNTTALEQSNENDIILAGLVEQTMRELKALQERR